MSNLRILQNELAIAEPEVVVFFTGPNYENRLEQDFPRIKMKGDWLIAQLKHEWLPPNSSGHIILATSGDRGAGTFSRRLQKEFSQLGSKIRSWK